ncbi:superoxide dismutase, Ni [Candidatus Microgenomates bacterium]|nr:superoxide dismutase, Ni [Candidatus Microgenomates bacterium]
MKILDLLIKFLPSKPVFAHCDIPCGIYDPKPAQIAAQTVLKMVQKLKEIKAEPGSPEELQARNNFVRMVSVKEQHAEICKREILILWTDYFKIEHLKKFPDLHELIWKTCKLCSDNKRAVDEVKAEDLVESVDKIAGIFNETSHL